jgi:hypothetical protein
MNQSAGPLAEGCAPILVISILNCLTHTEGVKRLIIAYGLYKIG